MLDEYGKTAKLGFGLMRLPKKGLGIDVEQVKEMVDLFLAAGSSYFDTAYIYPGSETAIRKALVERHPRDCYTLATKLNTMVALTEKMARKEFETSMERTGAGYFDYYLLHALSRGNVDKYERFHLWDFVQEEKAKGRIRHIGFSFHDSPELLEEIIQKHPEAEFVQLQINYQDWEAMNVQSRANYEVARKYHLPIVVMEPVKGGGLANPPKEVKDILLKANPDASLASWAIRFVASLDGILTVLSGMSNLEQMKDNLSYMADFHPLTPEEHAIIHNAQKILNSVKSIPCTACRYCTEGCPQQIPIPEIFAARNQQMVWGRLEEGRQSYQKILESGHGADACFRCGRCERSCPQRIQVIEELKKCHEALM
ncbi:MAG: aldo/keto reductase [Clostridia bacterium]|nr:aldo/keto reductase [Clostridia bacterium]